MKLFKNILIILLIPMILLFSGCDFSLDSILANDDGETEEGVECRYDWDETTDTNYYYEDDVLKWQEVYDYDAEGNCIFKSRLSPSGTTQYSYVYTWEEDQVVMESYFDYQNELIRFDVFEYDGDKLINHSSYNSSSDLLWVKHYTYNSDGNLTMTLNLDANLDVNWIYTTEFDGGEITESSYYNDDSGDRVGYITYSYTDDIFDSIIIGYGSASSSETYISTPKNFSLHPTSNENSQSRNTEGLTAPKAPTAETIPDVTTNKNTLTYSWKKMSATDDYGSTYVVLNEDYFPTHMERTAPDYLGDDIPIIIDIKYNESDMVASKVTSYNDEILLQLDFTYDDDGFPTLIDTAGEVLPVSLSYGLNFNPTNGEDIGITILSGDTMLQKFVYVFNDNLDFENLDYTEFQSDFSQNISAIENYDGNGDLVGTYNFNYEQVIDSENYQLVIESVDSSDVSQGEIIIAYDGNNNTSSVKSYTAEGEIIWDYSYSYDDLNNRISELNLDADGVPQLISGFDIETIFDDIKQYLPIDIPGL